METKLIKEDKAARLALYPAECKDDYWECVIADVGCPAPGAFVASIIGMDVKAVGAWLSRDGGAASMSFGREKAALRASKLELSDLSGDWDVSFASVGDAAKLWRGIAASGTLSLIVGGRTISFPPAGDTKKALIELAKFCAAE
ncbi:hypothetical protein MBRA_03795 [Methylobacterium brachiatum]|nr:hypothetical protein MBRA_03795 [Methylobacterium brachiatum]